MQGVVAKSSQDSGRVYYGKYRGSVENNEDPEQRGRLEVRVASVLGDQTRWALPCLPFGGLANQGLFVIPENGSQVWVEFEEGNKDVPIWTGTFWQQSGDPPEEAAKTPPTTRVLRTPSGHVLQFDDEEGNEQFRLAHPKGTEMTIDPQGTVNLIDAAENTLTMDAENNSVVLKDSNGNTLTMDSSGTVFEDSNGNQIQMAPAGITVKGTKIVVEGTQVAVGGEGGEPLIKGSSFLALFATHVHTCVAPGSPSSPPIPQGEMSTLTTKTTAT